MSFILATALLGITTTLTCSVPGIYLVLSKRAMLVDAISHSLLPGIVLGYLASHSLSSPLLLLTATLAAVTTVLLTGLLTATGLIPTGTAQGLIFPPMLACGVLLVTAYTRNIHLDIHTVLLGDLNLIAFDQLCLADHLCAGPKHLYLMLALLITNLLFVTLLRAQLNALTFDPEFAKLKIKNSYIINTLFLILVSLTATAAFAAVGSILIIALMIIPAATARLLVKRSAQMLPYTLLVAAVCSGGGFTISYFLHLPTSAGIAFISALVFFTVLARYALKRENPRQKAPLRGRWSQSGTSGRAQ
ncbi:metal ABC transporter permease [Canibacter sp. lx-72]|uniref:metal ABC transporter permease n=1 Tax=Canibacter zhuwentaonis TaxID=2837491 RepID=UPI001BDD32FE|nr:metal ABC transporter permease [Canibacter zhuwentaonis]MBT1018759.1 metal ABC transporter permease [Canibacter zhuwentaonis]